jgi:hypothetical protein
MGAAPGTMGTDTDVVVPPTRLGLPTATSRAERYSALM